ncbi:MAG: aldehyde dehydrogenase family protein, partial [Polaribacter sp.]
MSYSKPKFKEKYGNFINGEFVAPIGNSYFENKSPVDNSLIAKYPRSQKEDVDNAVAAANKAKDAWGNTSATEKAALLNKVADIIEENLEEFSLVETCDNGKPIRETLNADVPLSVDHWRYFAAVIRAEQGSATELDQHTLSMNIKEPLGVIAQIIPWNFPLLMLSWKLPPALAAGNCVV